MQKCDWLRSVCNLTKGLLKPRTVLRHRYITHVSFFVCKHAKRKWRSGFSLHRTDVGIALPKGYWYWHCPTKGMLRLESSRTWRTLLQRQCILAYQNAPGHQMLSRLVPSSLLLFPSPILEGRIRTNVLNALQINPTKNTSPVPIALRKAHKYLQHSGNNNPVTKNYRCTLGMI